jgi:hypothetical protein
MKTSLALTLTLILGAAIAPSGMAQDTGTPNKEALSKTYSGKVYSPYAGRDFPERPLWGDSHLHTSLSMDAGGFGSSRPCRSLPLRAG